jgi:hypothetical protein
MSVLLIAVVVFGLKNEMVTGEAAALLTILIDIAGFNAIEGHMNIGILIALFVIAILTAPRSRATKTSRYSRTQRDLGQHTRGVPTLTAMHPWPPTGSSVVQALNTSGVV